MPLEKLIPSMISMGLGQITNSLNANRNYDYAQRAAEQDLRRSKEFYDYTFDKVNSYNNPAAVRSRMAAAGINPYATDLSGSGATSSFGPGSISGDSTPGVTAAPAPTGLEAAQIRKLNAEAESIENQTPSSDDFTKRYSAESLGINLENIGRDFKNQVSLWDAKFAEVMKGLDVAKSSAELSNLHQEYNKLVFETKLLMNENRRDPLITGKLRREFDLLLVQGGLMSAQAMNHRSEALANFARIRNYLLEGDTLVESLRRIRMENSYLDKEKQILYHSLEEQLWKIERGSANTGYGKFVHRIGQLTAAIGNVFSGSASLNASYGRHSSIVTKTVGK